MQARLWNMSKPFLARINREMQNNLQQMGAFKKNKVKKKIVHQGFPELFFYR